MTSGLMDAQKRRGLPTELLLTASIDRKTLIAWEILLPRVSQNLDAEAEVAGVVASRVAVGFEPDDGVAALEKELFPVAHFNGHGE